MKKKMEAILWLLGICGLLAFLIGLQSAMILFALTTITFLLVGDGKRKDTDSSPAQVSKED